MSFIRSSGPRPSAAVAMDGSEKYRVGDMRIAALDLNAGHHASESSITDILRRALRYDDTVSSSGPCPSPIVMSLRMFTMVDCVPCCLAYDLKGAAAHLSSVPLYPLLPERDNGRAALGQPYKERFWHAARTLSSCRTILDLPRGQLPPQTVSAPKLRLRPVFYRFLLVSWHTL